MRGQVKKGRAQNTLDPTIDTVFKCIRYQEVKIT